MRRDIEKEFDGFFKDRLITEQELGIKDFIDTHFVEKGTRRQKINGVWFVLEVEGSTVPKKTIEEEIEGAKRHESATPYPEIPGDSWRMGYNKTLQDLKDKLL